MKKSIFFLVSILLGVGSAYAAKLNVINKTGSVQQLQFSAKKGLRVMRFDTDKSFPIPKDGEVRLAVMTPLGRFKSPWWSKKGPFTKDITVTVTRQKDGTFAFTETP